MPVSKSNFRKCPLCGQDTAAGHEFCDRCGRDIGNHCIACGTERKGNGTFCVKCGDEFRPFSKVAPDEKRGPHVRENAAEKEPPAPLLPVWFKRLILGSMILFVICGLGFWLTVWFMRQWADMNGTPTEGVASTAVETLVGEKDPDLNSQPIVIPDSMPVFSRDPRWQIRFEHWYVEYLPQFKPLSPGVPLELETRAGARMMGTLMSISNRLIMINRNGMEIGVDASQLTLNTLSRLFREEYAQLQAGLKVEQEQHNEGQKQHLRTVAATRSAHRPAMKPGDKPGPVSPGEPPTEFQTDLGIFKKSMMRLGISLLVIVGAVVVVRHLW